MRLAGISSMRPMLMANILPPPMPQFLDIDDTTMASFHASLPFYEAFRIFDGLKRYAAYAMPPRPDAGGIDGFGFTQCS